MWKTTWVYAAKWDQVSGWLLEARDAFVAQLSQISDERTPVPGLDWNVHTLAAHVAATPGVMQSLRHDADFEPPQDWTEFIAGPTAAFDGMALQSVTDAIVTQSQSLFDEIDRDPTGHWYLYGVLTTAAKVGAGYLGELLVHGRDLAGVTGAKVPISADQARAIIDEYITIAPALIDLGRAQRARGTYGLHISGGADYTIAIDDTGVMTTAQGRPQRADARVSADPVDYLLVTLGRRNRNRAMITGKMTGYGRRPWRLARLGEVNADGL